MQLPISGEHSTKRCNIFFLPLPSGKFLFTSMECADFKGYDETEPYAVKAECPPLHHR